MSASLNHYGAERVLPPSDFAVYTNEQYGWTAALVDGTNEVFAFAMPYPSGINLESQTIQLLAEDWAAHAAGPTIPNETQMMSVYLSMLDEEFGATSGAILTDVDDEEMRAHFDGPIKFGKSSAWMADATAGTAVGNFVDPNLDSAIRYYPWVRKVDLLTPLYHQIVGGSYTMGVVSEVPPASTDTDIFEQVTLKPIYTVRNLTSRERSMRNSQFQWMRLNS